MIIIIINEKIKYKNDGYCIVIDKQMIKNAKIKRSYTDKLLIWYRMILTNNIHLTFSIDKSCRRFDTCEFYPIAITEKNKHLRKYARQCCFYDLSKSLQNLVFSKIRNHLKI